MRKIVRLTERDITRLVRKVIKENEEGDENTSFDFSKTDNKLLNDFFTVKNDFKYENNISGMEIYSLPKRGYKVVVATKIANDPSNVELKVYLTFPMGKNINYLRDIKGRNHTAELPINDYNGITRLIQGAIDFGNAENEYDNLPPLPGTRF